MHSISFLWFSRCSSFFALGLGYGSFGLSPDHTGFTLRQPGQAPEHSRWGALSCTLFTNPAFPALFILKAIAFLSLLPSYLEAIRDGDGTNSRILFCFVLPLSPRFPWGLRKGTLSQMTSVLWCFSCRKVEEGCVRHRRLTLGLMFCRVGSLIGFVIVTAQRACKVVHFKVEVKLTCNMTLISDVQHNGSIFVYTAKWSLQESS